MSQADKLLESLTSEPGNIASGNIVIGDDCFITVPESLKKIAVQYDHNVETVTFDCPRYRDGHDMFKMKIYVNYLRADGVLGTHLCSNVVLDDNDSNLMHFDWTVSGHATYAAGDLSFLVCIKDVDKDGNEKFHWNTELNTDMHVSPGMKCNEVILAKHPDIITRLLSRMDETESFVRDIQVAAVGRNDDTATVEKTETDGSMKLTFGIPKGNPGASAYEVWLDMPGNEGKTVEEFLETLNGSAYDVWLSIPGNEGKTAEEFIASLKGTDGQSTTHSWNGTVLSVTSASGTSSADLKGEKGVIFIPSIDLDGTLRWDNNGGLENPNPVNIKGADGTSGTIVVPATLTKAGWSNNQQTIAVSGIVADEEAQIIRPIPAISHRTKYIESEILCVNQANNSLTFTTGNVPDSDISLYIAIQEVRAND